MRHPFYTDRLGLWERRKVRRLFLKIFGVYFSLVVLLVGGTMVKAKFIDPPSGSMNQAAGVIKTH
jgi:hypothetical protein